MSNCPLSDSNKIQKNGISLIRTPRHWCRSCRPCPRTSCCKKERSSPSSITRTGKQWWNDTGGGTEARGSIARRHSRQIENLAREIWSVLPPCISLIFCSHFSASSGAMIIKCSYASSMALHLGSMPPLIFPYSRSWQCKACRPLPSLSICCHPCPP